MEIVGEYYAITDEATGTPLVHVAPGLGKKAKFMVVADGPERSEEMERIFTAGRSFAFTSAALIAADLCSHDAYWTGLTKKRKIGKVYLPSDIKTYSPFLVRELEILKPPLIVTLGSNAARFFVPDLKGDIRPYRERSDNDRDDRHS
jgi:DNA polymerase-3 subunit alpha